MNYTTTKVMDAEVDKMYDLINELKKMSITIASQNMQNLRAINSDAPEALAEVRPLSKDERINEAKKYIDLFRNIHDCAVDMEEKIAHLY